MENYTTLPAHIQEVIDECFNSLKDNALMKSERGQSIEPSTPVITVRYQQPDGLGVGIFLDLDKNIILNEVKNYDLGWHGNSAIGPANEFGSLRAHFGWKSI
jgi:hypothetical protein